MNTKIYLTIDDSPSSHSDELTDFLVQNDVPAILFCRGDLLAEHPAPIIRAAEKGFVIANHAFSHQRASQMSFADIVQDIEKTQSLIEKLYRATGQVQDRKHFRFPHMDRGCGGWVVDYDATPEPYRETLIKLFGEGLNVSMSPPHSEQIERKEKLQEYLRAEGYQQIPSAGVTHDWFMQSEMADAIDAMFTFSTSDWMITKRHAGKWPYKTLDDLKQKIDDDPWLNAGDSANIVLLHDQDELLSVAQELVLHMKARGFEFSV